MDYFPSVRQPTLAKLAPWGLTIADEAHGTGNDGHTHEVKRLLESAKSPSDFDQAVKQLESSKKKGGAKHGKA